MITRPILFMPVRTLPSTKWKHALTARSAQQTARRSSLNTSLPLYNTRLTLVRADARKRAAQHNVRPTIEAHGRQNFEEATDDCNLKGGDTGCSGKTLRVVSRIDRYDLSLGRV